MSSFSLTQEQAIEFARDGVLFLPSFFPAHDMGPMAEAIWTDLHRRFGVERGRRETWTEERPMHFQPLVRTGAFAALQSPALSWLANALLGESQWTTQSRGLPLVTFPGCKVWSVPDKHWHLDVSPSMCLGPLSCMRLFVFLEPVHPLGGGTCFVSGSHRLALEMAKRMSGVHLHSREFRIALKQKNQWFADLFAGGGENRIHRFMVEGCVEKGINLLVREMTGEPGDLVVMHPALLHASSVNARDRPRMMLTTTLARRGFADAM